MSTLRQILLALGGAAISIIAVAILIFAMFLWAQVAQAGISKPAPVEPTYTALARPICAATGDIHARLLQYSLTPKPRQGVVAPSRGSLATFHQAWGDREGYGAIVQGDGQHACVVAVGKAQ